MGSFKPLNFLRSKWAWAAEKPLFWANLVLIGGTLLWVFVYTGPVTETGPSDFRLRTWGMVLQLLGAVTVWRDLTDSARKFGKGDFLKSTWEWLKGCFFGRNITLQIDSAAHFHAGGSIRMTVRSVLPPNATLEARIQALECNLAEIDKGLGEANKEIRAQTAKLKEQLGEESKKREEAHKELQKDLHDAIVGNYTKLAFGAAWVFVGIVVSAWAPEIAKIVAGQWPQVWAAV